MEAIKDAQLLEAIRLGREEFGDDHPLVRDAVRSLAAKEHRRVDGGGMDGLTAALSRAPRTCIRQRELSCLLAELLGEYPVHEARLPGFDMRRVDMLFVERRLAVEENGIRHARSRMVKERDAELRRVCSESGWALLEVDYREPLTSEHLQERLNELGIAI